MPVRRNNSLAPVVASLFVVFSVLPAHAGIIDMSMSGGNISSLNLPDGTWDEGQPGDWYYTAEGSYGHAWLYETWVGSSPVDFNTSVLADSDPDVTITKSLDNDTSFDWTDFHVDLIPSAGQGPITVYPGSVGSSRFSHHVVTNNLDGSAAIDWFTDAGQGDTPVHIGEFVSLFFTFNIPGSVDFRMIQVPTPEPTSLALMLLGGLAIVRRRR